MPHFVIASDFSPVAQNACHYACRMAAAVHASVAIVHTYIIPVTIGTIGMDTPMPVMPIDEAKEIATTRMAEVTAKLQRDYPELSISSDVVYGEPMDALSDYLDRNPADMVFLGNSGTGDTDLWMGSTVVSALRHLPHTVIAIPEKITYQPVQTIGLACDYDHLNESMPGEALQLLLQLTGARLHVLSVFKTVGEAAGKTDPAVLNGIRAAAPPVFHTLVSDNVDESIQQFAAENHIDWLVVVPQKHSFIEGLFHRSHTRAMVRLSHLPLVALHNKKSK